MSLNDDEQWEETGIIRFYYAIKTPSSSGFRDEKGRI